MERRKMTDLRDFLEALKKDGELTVVKKEVNP